MLYKASENFLFLSSSSLKIEPILFIAYPNIPIAMVDVKIQNILSL